MKLPKTTGLVVAVDTEGSAIHTDDGARICAVSCAWRDPSTNQLRSFASPFDMGLSNAHLGDKTLPSNHARRIKKLAAEHGEGVFHTANLSLDHYDYLVAWLDKQKLVMHHKKHDCHAFMAGLRNVEMITGYNFMPHVLADTMIRQKVLDPAESSALKIAAVRLHWGKELGIPEGGEDYEQQMLAPWKGPKDDPRFDLIPWFVLEEYARLDAQLTLIAHEHQQQRLSDDDDQDTQLSLSLIKRQERLSAVLWAMEERGVKFDVEWCLEQDALLEKLAAEAEASVPFRPTYPGAQKYFFGPVSEGGLQLIPFSDKLTKSGRPQVDEDVITRLVKQDVTGAREFQALMELRSARAKWYSAWPRLVGRDGRLRPHFKQGYVISGRLSCERWQAQAMPHDYQIPGRDRGVVPIRYGLIEDDGYELWEADVSQAEIRVATAVAKCGQMLRALKSDIDSHSAAALLMFYEQGTPLSEAMKDPQWSFYRGVPAKRSNLGILYGGGVVAIRSAVLKFTGIEYPDDTVRSWIQEWRKAFPPFVAALDNYSELASRQGWVRLVDGSRRYFSEWEPVHKAFNQRIQGDVAIAIEKAMIEFDRLYPGMLLLQIHDSLVARIPKDQVAEVTTAMQVILIQTFQKMFRPVPFKADVKPFGRFAYEAA